MITDLGSMTIGAAVPGAVTLEAGVEISVGIAAPDVSAQLAAALSFSASAMLSLTAQIDIALAIIANLEAAIAAGLTPPSLSLQASLAADISAALSLKLGALEAQLNIALALSLLLAEAGVRVLVYDGDQDQFGAELAAELGGDTSNAKAIVLLTQSSATWTAMQGVFLTS